MKRFTLIIIALLSLMPLTQAQRRVVLNWSEATQAMNEGRFGDAIPFLEYMAKQDPDWETLHWLAQAYYSINEYDKAKPLYERVLKDRHTPDSAAAWAQNDLLWMFSSKCNINWFNLPESEFPTEEYNHAKLLKLLDKAIKRYPKCSKLYLLRSLTYLELADIAMLESGTCKFNITKSYICMCRSTYSRIGEEELQHADADARTYGQRWGNYDAQYHLLYLSALRRSDTVCMLKMLESLYDYRNRNNDRFDKCDELMELYVNTGHTERVAELFAYVTVTHQMSDEIFTLTNSNKSLYRTSIIPRLMLERNRHPESMIWPYQIALVYNILNDKYKSATFYDEAYAKDPTNSITALQAGLEWYTIDNLDKAEQYFHRAITLEQSGAMLDSLRISQSYIHLANIAGYRKHDDQAMRYIDSTIAFNPNEPWFYFRRAILKADQQKWQEAIDELSIAITIYHAYYAALLRRARCYEQSGEALLAARDYNTVVSNDTVITEKSLRPFACLALGDTAETLKYIELCYKKNNGELPCHYNIACLHALMGHRDEAVRLLRMALENHEENIYWMARDPDLNSLRSYQPFIDLMQQYKPNYPAETIAPLPAKSNIDWTNALKPQK